MMKLILNFLFARDRIGHLGPEEFAIAAAQLMKQALDLGRADAKRARQLLVGNISTLGYERTAKRIEDAPAPARFAFLLQATQGALGNRRGPADIEEPFGRPAFQGLGRDRQARRRFRHPIIPGDKLDLAAAFLAPRPGVGVIEEVLQRFEEERTETAAFAIGLFKELVFQDREKEILGQVLRVRLGMTTANDEKKDRAPVNAAELGECFSGLGFVAFPIERGED